MSLPRAPAPADYIARRLARIQWIGDVPGPHSRLHLVARCRAELEWAADRWRAEAGDVDGAPIAVARAVEVGPGVADQEQAGDLELGSAAEVAAAEAEVQRQGIHAVPAIVVNQRHLIQGGQSVEVFEQLLRQVMAQPA